MSGVMRSGRGGVFGFTMIEILVALLIALTSIMGVAALLVRTTQQEVESSQRVEALVLLQDMVDRINANRQVAACYSNGGNGLTLGTDFDASTLPNCNQGSNTSQQNRAEEDLLAWDRLLKGQAALAEDNEEQGAMIGARGCIERVDAGNRIYRVTVAWQGLAATTAPNIDCGATEYGDEALRRVVTALVRIGDLS